MDNITIDLNSFDLPFDSDENDLESLESSIPQEACFVARFDDEVYNFTTWKIEIHYYFMQWPRDGFDWAVFCISWDDNWGCYNLESCGRIGGVADGDKAARLLIRKLFHQYWPDLDGEEYEAQREFLKNL